MTARKSTQSTRRDNSKAADATIKREAEKPSAARKATVHEATEPNAFFSPEFMDAMGLSGIEFTRIPTTKTVIISIVMQLATIAVGITAAGYIAAYLAVGAMVLGAGLFISLCLYYFTLLIGCLAAVYAGAKVGRWIITGQAADHMEAAGGWIKRKFTSASSAVKQRMSWERGDGATVH